MWLNQAVQDRIGIQDPLPLMPFSKQRTLQLGSKSHQHTEVSELLPPCQ